jgi:hypothetical protein
MKFLVNSDALLSQCLGDIRETYKRTKYVWITMTTGRQRSLEQNSQAAVWYTQIAKELREDAELDIKAQNKLRIGVPIMRRDSEEFRLLYDKVIKPHSYEVKLQMLKLMPVTSLMSTEQLSEYLVAMQECYKGRVTLEFGKTKGDAK